MPRVVNPSCSPVCLLPPSPHHHTSRRSLARGQTHLCTPSPLPPPCLHQGLLLLHQGLNDQDHLRLRKPALAAIFRPRGYFGCVEFIKSLRRAIFERGGGRVAKIVLEDGNSGGRQVGTCSSSSSSSFSSCSTRPPLSSQLSSTTPPASLPSVSYLLGCKYEYKCVCKYKYRLQASTYPTLERQNSTDAFPKSH